MNAAEKATNIILTSKIASVVSLFKLEFPDAKADLNPWHNDVDTRELVDPDSLDIGFHFPGWSRRLQSRSILVQIRLHPDPIDGKFRLIGIEAAGFDHRGKQWRLSTVDNWEFEGELQPIPEIGDKLKLFCRQVFELFSNLSTEF